MNKRSAGLVLARGNVELKSVPGAGNDAAAQFPFTKWPTLVRTDSIERVESASHVKQGDHSLRCDIFATFAWRQVAGGRNSNPVRHECILSHAAGRWTSPVAAGAAWRFRRFLAGTSFQRSCNHQY